SGVVGTPGKREQGRVERWTCAVDFHAVATSDAAREREGRALILARRAIAGRGVHVDAPPNGNDTKRDEEPIPPRTDRASPHHLHGARVLACGEGIARR